jgi:hypothetical protein
MNALSKSRPRHRPACCAQCGANRKTCALDKSAENQSLTSATVDQDNSKRERLIDGSSQILKSQPRGSMLLFLLKPVGPPRIAVSFGGGRNGLRLVQDGKRPGSLMKPKDGCDPNIQPLATSLIETNSANSRPRDDRAWLNHRPRAREESCAPALS